MQTFRWGFFACLVLSLWSEGYCSLSGYCQSNLNVGNSKPPGFTLKQLTIITRHGDRTPVRLLPGNGTIPPLIKWTCSLDSELTLPHSSPPRLYNLGWIPNREVLPGNCGLGILTEIGTKQLTQIGQNLRVRYIEELNFLPTELNPNDLYVRSTHIQRTIMSAESLLNGLYPTNSNNPVKIQINTMDSEVENMDPNPTLCPKLGQEFQQFFAEKSKTLPTDLKKLLAYLATDVFNVSTSDFVDVLFSEDNLHARFCHKLPFPNGIDLNIATTLGQFDADTSAELYNSTIMLGIGTFVAELLSNFENAGNTPKALYYSGHDTTIGPVLLAMGMNPFAGSTNIPYAAHTEFELWESSAGKQFIQGFYNGLPITFGGDCTLCSLAKIKSILTKVIPTNFNQQCKV